MISIKSNSLKLKIMALSIILITIPVIIIGIMSYHKTYNIMLESTLKNGNQLASQLAENTALSFFEIERFLTIGKNTSTIRYLLSGSTDERTKYSFELIKLIELYRSTYRFSDSVTDIRIIGGNSLAFSERKGVFRTSVEERQYLIDMFDDNNMQIVIQSGKDAAGEEQGYQILVGAPIFQVATNDLLGVIVLSINSEPFTNFTTKSEMGNHGYFVIADTNLVTLDQNGAHTSTDLTSAEIATIKSQRDGYFTRMTNGEEELVFFSTINTYYWKVIGRVYISDILGAAKSIENFTLSLTIIFLLVAILMNVFVMKWLFIPLDKLKKKMSIAAVNNLDVSLTHKTSDEIAQLNQTFNNMMLQIKELMQKNAQEQENLKKSQFRVLQAQINPHFLYNTLDTIIWLINANDTITAIDMVDTLSQFFRISLNKGQDFVTVREELEHATCYLKIQVFRNRDMLDYDVDVSEDILNYKIMNLLIQPLVENAIYHGLKRKKNGGKIRIYGYKDGEALVISVSDNGVGIQAEKLKELQDMLAQDEMPFSENDRGYGLFNVQQRIKLYYSSDYGVTIESSPDLGTCVTIRIRGESY